MNAADVLDTLKAARLPPPAALAAVVANPDDFASAVYETVEKAYRGVVLLPGEARVLLYGLHGLAAARHPGLWPRLVQVARLPEDDLDDLLLNHPEPVLAKLMLSAWDGDVDALLHLIEHADMAVYGKLALFACLSRLTFDGRIPRDRTLEFLARFEQENLADDDDLSWLGWVDAVARLGATELEAALSRVWEKAFNSDAEADEKQECLALMGVAVADPSDVSIFDEAGLRAVDDPVEALGVMVTQAELFARWDAEAAAILEAETGVIDPAKGVTLEPEEFDWLAKFLVSRQAPPTAMSIEMLDGFLTALVIGPEDVPPAEYMPQVWGTEDGAGPAWDSPEQQKYFADLLIKQQAAIKLRRDADALQAPILLDDDDDERGCDWVDGFLIAVDLRVAAWEPLYKDQRGERVAFSLYALANEDDAEEILGESVTPEMRAILLEALPETLQSIGMFWRHPDHRMPRREPIRTVKIGRNEPCPCGSGKKYKKCCGNAPPPLLN